MRGLTVFIGDIRNCKTKEAEQKRIDKELAHIREQFTSKNLDGYGKKKYVWKLLYMYMMGYDIEIGHMEALQLIAVPKYSEKLAGYMACSILFNESSQLLRLIIQQVKNDLALGNNVSQSLALSCVANVGGQDFAESLTNDVQRVLIASNTHPFVRKKAALCLLRLFRKFPDVIPQDNKDAPRIIALLEDPSLGVALCVSSLLLGLVSHNAAGYEEAVTVGTRVLATLNFAKDRFMDYRYYHTLCPWLQVKVLRVLQYFPPPSDKQVLQKLNEVLVKVLTKTEVTKSVNKNNADHAILFEAVNLVISMCLHGQMELHSHAVALLGRFISVKEPNIRYLGLETMSRLARVPGTLPQIKKHQSTVQFSLKDPDISIRKRALDLLYVMCDSSNAVEIVEELIKQVEQADYQFKEELVLKIAILAEKYAKDLKWYIDTILKLVNLAGAFISDDIWFRVVQIVTNNEDLQEYAASTCLAALKSPNIHENGVKVGGYVLGEFGHHLIKDDTKMGEVMFDVLQKKFATCSFSTKSLLLSAFIKMSNSYPELKDRVDEIFRQHSNSGDAEIQQRAVEYLALNSKASEELMNTVFDVMPNFPERESALIRRIKKLHKGTADRNVWADGKDGEDKAKKDEEEEEDDEDEDDHKQEGEEEDDDDEVQKEHHSGSDDDDDAKKPTKPAVVQDLFGGGLPVSPRTGLASPRPDHDWPAQSDNIASALIGKTSGVLYDSEKLQIGIKVMPATGPQCKMIVYYGNRAADAFVNLRAEISNVDGLKVQLKPTEPIRVDAKAQIPHYLLWQCFKPFKDVPIMTVTFNFGGTDHSLNLKLPVVITQFCTPIPQEPAAFVEQWKSLAANQDVSVLNGEVVVKDIGEFKQLCAESLHLAVVEGVESNADNFSLSGTFHTSSKNAQGDFITMPVLIRFETKPDSKFVRISTHAGHKSVTTACVAAVGTLLRAKAETQQQ